MKRQSVRISELKTKIQKTENSVSLVKAVKNKSSFEEVQRIFNLGVNLEQEDDDNTALMYAVMYGNLQVAALLLSGGADVESVDSDGNTVLMHAVTNISNCDFIEKILEKSSENILSENDAENTALLLACKKGDPEIVKLLLKHGASVLDRNKNDGTPLIVATEYGHFDIIKILISAGADIEARDIWGQTALFKVKNLESLRVLLQSGADPMAESEIERSAIFDIISNRCENLREKIALMLKVGVDPSSTSKGFDNTLLITLCQLPSRALHLHQDYIEAIQYLLKNSSVNPSQGNKFDSYALTDAIYSRSTDIIKILLNAGANPSTQDMFGRSFLMRVCDLKLSDEMLKMLIQEGANVCATDNEGQTTLMHAIKNRNLNHVKCLLEAGAYSSQKDKQGNSAMSEVLKLEPEKNSELINLVVNSSFNTSTVPTQNLDDKITALSFALKTKNHEVLKKSMNQIEFFKDLDGKNLLMKACELKEENIKLVEFLIQHFSVLSAQDKNGKTALMLAFENMNFRSLKMLIKAGVNISRQDNTGTSLFMMACKSGNLEIVKLLLKHDVSSLIHNNKGETAAMLAASENHLNVLCYLLKHGACSCVHKDKEGNSVLSYILKNRVNNDIPVHQDFEKTLNFIVEYGTNFDDVAIVTEVIRVYMKYYRDHHAILLSFYKDFTRKIVNKATSLMTNSTILIQHQRNIHYMLMNRDGDFKNKSDIFYIIIKSAFKCLKWSVECRANNNPQYTDMIGDDPHTCETIAYLIYVCQSYHYGELPEDLYHFYCTMIDTLIENGYSVNSEVPTVMSSLSVVLGYDNFNEEEKEKYVLKLAQKLIDNGIRKCQFILRFSEPQKDLLRQQLQLPDAVWIAFQSGYSSALPLLVPYWSGPPLTLFLFLSLLEGFYLAEGYPEEFDALIGSLNNCFDVLMEMCGPLPPGNEHIPTIQLYLDALANRYEPARPLALKFRTLHSDGNLPSLQNLCRYVIRGSAQSGDDLPERLSSLPIPNDLKTFISLKEYVPAEVEQDVEMLPEEAI